MLNGLYVVINQLIKSIGKTIHLNKFLTYMFRGKKSQSNKKWMFLSLQKIMVFKRFNLTKMSTLTKRMFILTKGMEMKNKWFFWLVPFIKVIKC